MRWVCLAALGCVLAVTGCSTNRRSTVEMTAAGRHVTVTSDKIASITFDNQHFVISLSAKKCIVERERVLYDGKEQTKIPAEAASIVIEFIEGKLTIIADGVTVREPAPPL